MSKKTSIISIPFALASAWFGTHCGSGFATGAQATSFWVRYGAWAFILPWISIGLMGVVAYWEWNFCQTFKTYDYRYFANKLFHPYERIFGMIYSTLFLGIMVMGVSAVFAGAGELLSSMFAIPFVLGVAIIIGITILLTIFGSKILLRAASVLSLILIVIITIVTIIGLTRQGSHVVEIASTWETDYSMASAIFSAILYGSFQCTILGATINISDGLQSTKDSKIAAWLGIIMNGFMMVLVTYMLLGWYPDINGETLPVLSILKEIGIPILQTLYSLMLLLAFITTAITCIGSILKRVEGIGVEKIENITVRRGIYSFIIIMICFAISQFGLLAIIRQGYSAIGYLGIPFVIIPILLIAPRKIKKEKESATG